MKFVSLFFISLFIIISCNSSSEFHTKDFILKKANDEKAVVFLFPCFPCNAEHTQSEAKFIEDLVKNEISVVLLNENQKLFFKQEDLERVEILMNEILKTYKISNENIVIGGFSSGGNLALQFSSYLMQINKLKPKSIFIVDSPVDLVKLYKNAQNDVDLKFHQDAVSEGEFLLNYFYENVGHFEHGFDQYKKYSSFINLEEKQPLLDHLNNIKIRLYAEPDLEWQKLNRGRNFENLNAFQLENLHHYLRTKPNIKSELIFTEGKGVKSTGERHPHSWSIVEGDGLSKWILAK